MQIPRMKMQVAVMVLAVLLAAVTLATAATQQQGYWKCPKDRCRFIGDFESFGQQKCKGVDQGEEAVCCQSSTDPSSCWSKDQAHGGYNCAGSYDSKYFPERKTGARYGFCCYGCTPN